MPGDPQLTIGCVKGGEAINMVTSKTPFTRPIGKLDMRNEVALHGGVGASGIVVVGFDLGVSEPVVGGQRNIFEKSATV